MINKPPIIHVTKDYKKFTLLSFNRKINHTRKLFEILDNCNKLYLHPIIVTPNFKIIDGQHRWEYAQERHVPLYYIIDENFSASDLISHNTGATTWLPADFAKFYIECDADIIDEEARSNYKLAFLLCKDYDLKFDVILRLFAKRSAKASYLTKDFRSGKLSFRKSHSEIITNAENIKNITQYIKSQKIKMDFSTNFYKALHGIITLQGYDENKFINKLDNNIDDLVIALKFQQPQEIFTRLLAIYNKNSKLRLQG